MADADQRHDAGSRMPLLEADGIVKRFGHVEALSGAALTVYPQEVVALVGDNGAGKSTLVKTLAGAHQPNAGTIVFEGTPVALHSAIDARRLGIEVVYQDLALAPDLDPVANLHLGRERMKAGLLGKLGFLDNRAMSKAATEGFKELGVTVGDSRSPVATMSGGQQQGVAVSRAVTWASRVVFMDEPTAALGVRQTRNVLEMILRVKESGRSVVLISHNLPEVLEVADRIEVLRLGKRVAQLTKRETDMQEIISAMTGALPRLAA